MVESSNSPAQNDFYVQAVLLGEVIRRILKKRGDIDLSSKPIYTLKPITEFTKRMRVCSIEKFNETTYIATVNFFSSQEDLNNHKAIGAIVLYISEDYLPPLLKRLEYPIVNEDDEEALKDACGTLCNLIGGNFKSGLIQLNYQELVMSHFSTYRNEVLSGVLFDPSQKEKYELSFFIADKKRIMADLTMGKIEKIKRH